MSLSLSSANFILFATAGLFYGMYLVLFCMSTYLLVQRRGDGGTTHSPRKNGAIFKSMLLPLSILLFVAITGHWIANTYRAFVSFVTIQSHLEAEGFIRDSSRPSALVENSFLTLSFVVGDSMIIYRLWVVWSHSKRVLVIPVVTLTTFAIGSAISTSRFVVRSPDIFADPWLKYLASLTLITNLYCTSFIGWKIWSVTRLSMVAGGSKLRHFLVVVVESAALYAILFVIAFGTRSNFQLILIEAGPELIGLVNALIMTRVGLGWTSEQIEGPPSALVFAGSCRTL
ncbi:hypothetical protein C8R46DRAFT_1215021 [Mycena filopes]|nr:hypothetical protein C8R46DRAFT_1215021 [Mycena filopes]